MYIRTSFVVLFVSFVATVHSAYFSCEDVWTSGDTSALLDTSGLYDMTFADGIHEQRCVFSRIDDINQVFVGTMFESFSLANKLSQRCSWVADSNDACAVAWDTPTYDQFRWQFPRIDDFRSNSADPYLFVSCNGQTATTSNEDYLLMPFDVSLLTTTSTGACLSVTSISVRGQGCPDTVIPIWADGAGNSGHGFHTDSSYYDDLCPASSYASKKMDGECNLATGAAVEEDNFGHYNHPTSNFQCSAQATSTTNYFVGTLHPVQELTDSCSVDVSLTQLATSSDCATTCWNYCAGAGCDGYAVNSWYGHLGTVTNTMLMDDGNVYDEFIVLHPPNNGIGFGEYQLDGSYTRFTGLVGQARSNDAGGCVSGGDWHFSIKADGVVKFTSQQFNHAAASQYEEVDIDITGATVLRLESYADGSWGCDWATIADPTLWVCASGGDSCDASEIATFDWDSLMKTGAAKPEVVSFDMAVDTSAISLDIQVALTYEGLSSADIYGQVYGTTYVLDFEDFDAHQDSIAAPGTCQNRNADDFGGAFDTFWQYSLNPVDDIGTAAYLAYPPPNPVNGQWTVAMHADNECGTVVYNGRFTWNDLVACQSGSSPIRQSMTPREDAATGKLNLEGTFYVNAVSPYAASGDTGFYRVYQLLSQPFIISVNKNIQVLKGAGVNLFTISVIAVYKQDVAASRFRLVVLTESAEYLQLSRTGLGAGLALFETSSIEASQPQMTEFTVAETAEHEGCLNNKDYICSQLWQIEAPGDCSLDQAQYIDFSGNYTLQFTPVCRAAADLGADGVANATALHDYCSGAEGWLATHGDLVTDGVGLTATLQWRDEECDPLLFEVQFEADMLFYTDDAFTSEAGSTLYQVGEDRVYVLVDTDFPEATYDVFDTTLLSVWICTFDPLTPPVMPIEASELSGGCFSTNIDGYEFATDNAYAYHIFDSQSTVSVPDFIEFDLVGHPSTDDSDKDKLQFSFVVPPKIARDTLYIHAQIEVSLTGVGGGRRRMLYRLERRARANQMSHFLGNIGVGDVAPPQNPKPLHHEALGDVPSVGGDNYVLSLQSPLILAFAGLLAVILTFNIVYMAVRCCGGGQRATVSFGGRSKRNYKPVNVADSEVDDSEAQLNVVSE